MWLAGSGEEEVATIIVDAAVHVHQHLGPELLEAVYELCLAHELAGRNLPVERQVAMPVVFDGVTIDNGFRVDLMVDSCVILEAKAVETVLPVHRAQPLSYLRLSNRSLGLLLNFNVARMAHGIGRVVNDRAQRVVAVGE